MEYKTIKTRVEARFTEKKSEFIGYLSPVSTDEAATAFVAEIRALHPKARHNCYAYILRENNAARHSDDGEPQGTAGVPIYEVLRKEGITDVCCVVTRYFGGILLGAGGLVRAYTKAARDAVDAAKIRVMASAVKAEISLDYALYGRMPQIFSELGAKVEAEDFSENVKITIFVREENFAMLCEKITDACNGSVEITKLGTELFDFA